MDPESAVADADASANTDTGEQAQPDASGESTSQNADTGAKDDAKPSPTEEAIQAGIDAKLPTLAEQRAEQLYLERTAREREETAEAEALATFDTGITKTKEQLIAAGMSAEQADAALGHLSEVRGGVRKAEAQRMTDALTEAALELIPEDAIDEFGKKAGGKPLAAWLDELAEVRAPNSRWAKQQEKEHEAVLKKEYARGFEEGANGPPGQPSQSGSKGGRQSTYSTLAQLTAAKSDGTYQGNDQEFLVEQDRLLGITS